MPSPLSYPKKIMPLPSQRIKRPLDLLFSLLYQALDLVHTLIDGCQPILGGFQLCQHTSAQRCFFTFSS